MSSKDKKKVLIIAYYWPPAGGPGVQRWLKFIKYLPQFNIEPTVYVPSNPNYPIIDESLLNEIPEEITVLKQPIREPYRFAKILSKKKTKSMSSGVILQQKKQSIMERLLLLIRGNFFIPDARIAWVRPSIKYLQTYITDFKINTVITTGPPHSLHLIGKKLKENLGIKWIVDFRDPWTTIGYHKQLRLTELAKKKHKSLEQMVLNQADEIIVTTKVTKKEFAQITTKPIHVITNGFDVETKNRQKNIELDKKFTISHIGSLLSKRNPIILWRVLGELILENKEFAKNFQLKLVGIVSEDVLVTIENYNLINYVINLGYVSHNEAIAIQKKSQVLLLIEINSEETKSIIPGKLFEYITSKRPILAFGPEDTDVEIILNDTKAGNYFLYADYEKLKAVILGHYKKFKQGTLSVTPRKIEGYNRKVLTQQLSKLL